ncbi:MAG: electron transfer flavoprotein-ubiquinone oxidoreductase [Gammaproteobacteria bacterium]|jgi:electron-transferring-flavoprotein dehydrogenase|nr:electron transfer flavoprotein-ubiquinone oxidoreductase [Gammaproteobacteria bacterium]
MEEESISFDVLIVGAGPAGLSAAIRLAQHTQGQTTPPTICVIEKGSEVGAHILSGAVLNPKALSELLLDWETLDAPLLTPVTEDHFLFLTKNKSFKLRTPPSMNNEGNYIISLGKLCKFLAKHAEMLGIQIFPGFPGHTLLYDKQDKVCGVKTNDSGRNKDGTPGNNFRPGINIYAKQTILAEGCRGSLSKAVIKKFQLDKDCDPQTYGLGIKEIWEIDQTQYRPGKVVHSIGWPLNSKTYGGSFLYHIEDQKIAVGFVTGMDYQNPYLDPYEEFQRFKTHPVIAPIFKNATRIAYGARTISEGGLQSIPGLIFPGGLLVGDAAGFLNVPAIKGIHTSMKSAMLAADAIFEQLYYLEQDPKIPIEDYERKIELSWIYDELHQARNIRPAFRWGLWTGLAYAALDTYVLKGKAPWTLKYHRSDHQTLKKAKKCKPIRYPKHDGKVTFHKLDSVYLSNTQHRENEPCHLVLRHPEIAIAVNLKEYAAPETRYCPAGVYEIIQKDGQPTLQINAANCVHCKACDIKDPEQNINWVTPEGGSGPNYEDM